MVPKFCLNQIVRGAVCGHFVIIAYRLLNGRFCYVVKSYSIETGATTPGEMSFEEDMLREAV